MVDFSALKLWCLSWALGWLEAKAFPSSRRSPVCTSTALLGFPQRYPRFPRAGAAFLKQTVRFSSWNCGADCCLGKPVLVKPLQSPGPADMRGQEEALRGVWAANTTSRARTTQQWCRVFTWRVCFSWSNVLIATDETCSYLIFCICTFCKTQIEPSTPINSSILDPVVSVLFRRALVIWFGIVKVIPQWLVFLGIEGTGGVYTSMPQ